MNYLRFHILGAKLKRILFFLILLFSFSFLAVSNAENFYMRNGITYGITKNEILSLEQQLRHQNPVTDDGYKIVYSTQNVAGIDNTVVTYYCNRSSGLLEGISYHFGTTEHLIDGNSIYNTIYSSLVSKYGEPTTKDAQISTRLFTQEFYDWQNTMNLYKTITMFLLVSFQ